MAATIPTAVVATGAAFSATGCAMGITACVHSIANAANANKAVEVSSDAVVRLLGVAPCRVKGSWRKVRQQATLVGDLLILSKKEGSADVTIDLKDVGVVEENDVLTLTSSGGDMLVRFWPEGKQEEISRWAAILRETADVSVQVPKLMSGARVEMEALQANTAELEAKIKCTKETDPTRFTALEVQKEEKEKSLAVLETELAQMKEMPKMLSLTRKQVAEMMDKAEKKESAISELQAQLSKLEEVPKKLSLSRRELASMVQKAGEKKMEARQLQVQIESMQDASKILSLDRKQVEELKAQTAQKDGIIASLRRSLDGLQDLPKALRQNRMKRAELEVESVNKDHQICALELQVQNFKEFRKIVSLSNRQVKELQKATKEKEQMLAQMQAELEALRAQSAAPEAEPEAAAPEAEGSGAAQAAKKVTIEETKAADAPEVNPMEVPAAVVGA